MAEILAAAPAAATDAQPDAVAAPEESKEPPVKIIVDEDEY